MPLRVCGNHFLNLEGKYSQMFISAINLTSIKQIQLSDYPISTTCPKGHWSGNPRYVHPMGNQGTWFP